MSERWRLFVAVPLGEELRATLATRVETWRQRSDLAGMRWTDPTAWHVTLLFLGSTDPAKVGEIASALRSIVAHHQPMDLETGGLGGFGSTTMARVAWYGIHDPERRLRRLADDVRAALTPDEAARFRAHVTLARARDEPVDLRPWIAEARPPEGCLKVREIRLMRSHLRDGPARHEMLDHASLGASVHV